MTDFSSVPFIPRGRLGRSILALIGLALFLSPGAIMAQTNTEDTRRVRINQYGYLPDAPKFGMIRGKRGETVDWIVVEAESGETRATGTTSPGRFDRSSGDTIQIADFSALTAPGRYRLVIDGIRSTDFTIAPDLYRQLAVDAARYFYLNRSGIALEPEYAGEWARPAGHLTDDSVTCFAGRSKRGRQYAGCDYRLNARGGWYDAGDYGKYVVNGGIALWTLHNLYEVLPDAFPDGSLNIPERSNGIPDVLDEARWQMEFLLGMQVPAGQPLGGMAHHKLHNLQWPPVPAMPPTEIANDDPEKGRYLFPPTTAATLNLAATAAQCARLWRPFDTAFSARCLVAAKTAWLAARNNRNRLAEDVPGSGGGNYEDRQLEDEFFWAAAELYVTTGDETYQDFLRGRRPYTRQVDRVRSDSSVISWSNTGIAGLITLAVVPNDLPERDQEEIRRALTRLADALLSRAEQEAFRVTLRPNHYIWGSNSSVLNNALVMAVTHRLTGEKRYWDGAAEAFDYLLGRNALGQSFITGYGARPAQNPHHRFWGNQPDKGFPPPPPGVVVGGPIDRPQDPTTLEEANLDGGPAKRYIDRIGAWSSNEVTINWNAPLAWLAAYLADVRP